MSTSLTKIRKRISSIDSTMKITKAMKMVSSSKMIRKKRSFYDVCNYQREVQTLLKKVIDLNDVENLALIKPNQGEKELYIVTFSDVGLCGSYNNSIYKYTLELTQDKNCDVLYFGNKGKNKFPNAIEDYQNFFVSVNGSEINKFFIYLKHLFLENKYKEIHIVYTNFKNALFFENTSLKLLPFDLSKVELKKEILQFPYHYESILKIKENTLEMYLSAILTKCIYSSLLSEESMRRNAMDNATKNAEDISKQLKLQYNKLRQENITMEIQDIVVNSMN